MAKIDTTPSAFRTYSINQSRYGPVLSAKSRVNNPPFRSPALCGQQVTPLSPALNPLAPVVVYCLSTHGHRTTVGVDRFGFPIDFVYFHPIVLDEFVYEILDQYATDVVTGTVYHLPRQNIGVPTNYNEGWEVDTD